MIRVAQDVEMCFFFSVHLHVFVQSQMAATKRKFFERMRIHFEDTNVRPRGNLYVGYINQVNKS